MIMKMIVVMKVAVMVMLMVVTMILPFCYFVFVSHNAPVLLSSTGW